MGMKEYILWGGGLLVVLVVGHGLWQAWRSRRRRAVVVEEHAAATGQAEQTELFEPPVLLDDVDASGRENPGGDLDPNVAAAHDSAAVAGRDPIGFDEFGEQPARVGRRISIPGKRTEPTVPRNDHLFKVTTRAAPEAESQPESGLDEVVVIWVVAKSTRFAGPELVQAFADNALKYGDDAFFHKYDIDSGGEVFSVVNGVEPGTFDLSDVDGLSTPRIVVLMSLATTGNGLGDFAEMLNSAQNIGISLGGELRDENMNPMSGQTIEHYRQRISDFKRKSLGK